MTYWHLLWMFVTALGIIALLVALPFTWEWATEGHERAFMRHFAWRHERSIQREVDLYGQRLRPCLYCGSRCEFGPGCANHDLAPKAVAP